MKINIIANHLRAQRGEKITLEQAKAELKEVKSLRPVTANVKLHQRTLESYIRIMEKSKTLKNA